MYVSPEHDPGKLLHTLIVTLSPPHKRMPQLTVFWVADIVLNVENGGHEPMPAASNVAFPPGEVLVVPPVEPVVCDPVDDEKNVGGAVADGGLTSTTNRVRAEQELVKQLCVSV
jgi:hypothetical protein